VSAERASCSDVCNELFGDKTGGGHDPNSLQLNSGSCTPKNISSFTSGKFIRGQISHASPDLIVARIGAMQGCALACAEGCISPGTAKERKRRCPSVRSVQWCPNQFNIQCAQSRAHGQKVSQNPGLRRNRSARSQLHGELRLSLLVQARTSVMKIRNDVILLAANVVGIFVVLRGSIVSAYDTRNAAETMSTYYYKAMEVGLFQNYQKIIRSAIESLKAKGGSSGIRGTHYLFAYG
jgi:hypothetical protein